jgi:general secretion pathway protein J
MVRQRGGYERSGFTLLEILIALSIVAVVFTSLYGVYNSTLETTEVVERGTEVDHVARLALLQMADDFKSLYYVDASEDPSASPYLFVGGEIDSLEGAGTVVEFASTAHLDFSVNSPGLRISRLRYILEKEGDNGGSHRLIRHEQTFPTISEQSSESTVELADGVEQLTLIYVDTDGQTSPAWDSSATLDGNPLPRLIAIRLRMAGGSSGQPREFALAVAPIVGERKRQP